MGTQEENAETNKPLSMVKRLKQKSENSKKYGGDFKLEKAKMETKDCPNCGASRAISDGIRQCAYCDFEFLKHHNSAGIHLNREKDKGGTIT